jgi:four helix bundle protein
LRFLHRQRCSNLAETATTEPCFIENPNDLAVAALMQMLAGMTAQQLRDRTRAFAKSVVHLCLEIPAGDWVARVLGTQLLKSATAVAANYRAACRGRSGREFCARIGVVAEEADETILWLELLAIARLTFRQDQHARLAGEAEQLTAIFTAS